MDTPQNEIGRISIARVSMASQVAAVIRGKILGGELKPGSQLAEIPLAAWAGVSRNTMREAIQVLVREGLVRHSKHRGGTVTKLKEKDIDDIYQARRCLERAGIRAACVAAPDQIVELERIVSEIGTAAKASDWSQMVSGDLFFHHQLVTFLGSDRLNRFYNTLLSELRLGLVLVDRTTFDGSRLFSQHSELLELIRTGQTEECVARLTEHLAESERNLRDVISKYTEGARENP
jgi:DNA-binding GntR family transcriptional regulator